LRKTELLIIEELQAVALFDEVSLATKKTDRRSGLENLVKETFILSVKREKIIWRNR
jgi:hypothetical protein